MTIKTGASQRRLIRTLMGLALIAFAAHSLALIGLLPGALPATGDTLGAFVPWHEFARRAFWERGEMPLWNPHLYCGVPFMGNGQSGLLYPPNLIFRLLPESLALWLFAYGHTLFLMVGGYFLGRTLGMTRRAAFLVGVLSGLGNANPGRQFLGHLTFLPVRSYWPWEAAFLLRLLRGQGLSNGILLAACIALGLVAGAPQIWLFGLLFSAGIFLFWIISAPKRRIRAGKKVMLPLALCATLVGLWCLPILLPLREMLTWSSHGDSMTFAEVTSLSATWRSLFRLLFNGYFGGNSFFMWSLPSNPPEDAASIGLAAFVLALLAPCYAQNRRVVFALCGFCIVTVLLALGSGTPLYGFLYDHSSFFQSTRVPARWLELWAFAAALLAGFAFDGALREPKRSVLLLRSFSVAFGACLVLLVVTSLARAPWETGAEIIVRALGVPAGDAPQIARNLQTDAITSVLISAAGVGLIAWFLRRGLKNGATIALILGFVCFDPLSHFWLSTTVAPAESVSNARIPPSLAGHYQSGERWIIRAPFGQLNSALIANIDILNGYEPFGSTPFFEFASAAQPSLASNGAPFAADFQPEKMTPLWRVAGVTHLIWKPIFPGDQPLGFSGKEVAPQRLGWNLSQLDDGLQPWPRAYLTQHIVRAAKDKRYDVLADLARRPHPGSYPVVVEPGFPAVGSTENKPLTVTSRTASPDVLEWDISTPQAAVFVHQAARAPGWTAFVDGRRVPVHRVNGFFRGVPIPAHAKRVALVYDSQTLRFSLFLALAGVGLAASFLMVIKTGRRERPISVGRR